MTTHEQHSSASLAEFSKRFREHFFGSMSFPEPYERQFDLTMADAETRRQRNGILVLILLMIFFSFRDFHSLGGSVWFALKLRGLFFTPVALAIYVILRPSVRPRMRGSLIVLLATECAFANPMIYFQGDRVRSAAVQMSLLLVLLYTAVIMRPRWRFSLVAALLCDSTVLLYLFRNPRISWGATLQTLTTTTVDTSLVLYAAYRLEREERALFLMRLKDQERAQELSIANAKLELLSSQDGLTQLANRAAFDRQFELMWSAASRDRTSISVVMVDIDHFKVVNDTQGHLYGDEVIKRVAALVQQGLRGKDDFAARYGGEEFVLLLPGADLDGAMRVAERVRTIVQLAGSPAPVEPVPEPGLWTTVSCGVATAENVSGLDRRRLLLAADTALYAAKAEGRNRVRSARAEIRERVA